MPAPTLNASRKTKKTAIGEIPVEWAVHTLEEVCEIVQDGTHFSPKSTTGPHRYLTSKNIKPGRLALDDCSYISEEEHKFIYKRCRVIRGDLLMTKDGAKTGSACLNPLDEEFSLLSSVVLIRAHPEKTTNEFLLQQILSPRGQKQILDSMSGQAITRITLETLKSLHLIFPPLPEQRRIAAVLGAWDCALAGLEKLLAAKQQRKQALMQQLLTGKKRFPEFKGQKWRTVHLGDVFDRVVRRVTPEVEHVLSITARVGFVTQQSKFSKVIAGKTLERYILLRKGEFAYNKGNSKSYKQGCIYKLDSYDEAAVPQVYICFGAKTRDVDSEFYRYYFEAGLLNSQLMGIINSGVRNDGLLNMDPDNFFKLHIHVPPLAEQHNIAGVFRAVDRELALLEREAAALRDQKKGLMQQLLTGKVRVKS